MSDTDMASTSIPVALLTGFLGSGKTTLLNRLINDPALKDTLVLINEFGEIGLDHHLIQSVDAEMVVMASGCLCCTIQSDLAKTLRQMALKRVRGEVPEFKRVVLETTGLADPAPIIHTLMEDPLIGSHYRLDGVITTVDAVTGSQTLDRQVEAVKQAAVADRIVLTKTDLAEGSGAERLVERLRRLNPGAPILAAASGEATVDRLFDAGLYDPATKSLDAQRWLNAEAYEAHEHDHGHGHDHEHDHAHGSAAQDPHDVNRHDKRIHAVCLTIDEPLDWDGFALWAQSLAAYRGEDLLRLKALINVKGNDKPVAVHGVQHLFHPPAELPDWPSDDRRSRIVLITRDMSREMLEDSLKKCLSSAILPPADAFKDA
ncbi:MAG TPA: GTP-binding protein [Candidatus Sulfotelmatobacter sp.]|nr:GTP-binding protein [Candidatus Sulfotelmatobacter sp.]